MSGIKELYKKYIQIPQDFQEQISAGNRRVLKILFIISLFFGIIFLPIALEINTISNIGTNPIVFVYYGFLIAIGIIGLFLLRTKIPTSFLVGVVLVSAEVIITINFISTPIANSILVFIGFVFALVMVLNINPILFMVELTIYFLFLFIVIKTGILDIQFPDSHSFVQNIVLVLIVIVFLVFWKRRHIIGDFNRDTMLASKREQTEALLRNILPGAVIEQLKVQGKSTPQKYENISVLVSDIVDFTKTASVLQPYVIINELNDIFTEFDKITEHHHCFRIKTVGDAYMAVCGLPEIDENHAENLILCAKEFIKALEKRNEKSKIKWNIRTGIASGSVIAGIIGKEKYLYDILGDTVDNAVRMQNSCTPMHIKISYKTYELLFDKENLGDIIEMDGLRRTGTADTGGTK